MFNVTVVNNSPFGFFVDGGNQVFGQGTHPFPNLSGIHFINPGPMGNVVIIDLGDKKLDRYTNDKLPWTKQTWGGVIRYRGDDAYFRYEGTGNIKIVIDNVGSIQVQFDQGGMQVGLEEMTVG